MSLEAQYAGLVYLHRQALNVSQTSIEPALSQRFQVIFLYSLNGRM